MARVTFKLDYKKDAKNYWQAANSTPHYGHDFSKAVMPQIRKRIRGKSWKKSRNYLYTLLRKNYKKDWKMINLIKKQFSEAWKLIESEYFKRLERVMKKPICAKKFTAYVTTIGRCPYDEKENSFMVNLWESTLSALETAAHELMHLQFHRYYWNKCRKELSCEKTHDLKEALTVLLNKEFLDLIMVKDRGYPAHQKLREHLAKVWDKTHDFDEVIKEGIKFLKSN